MSDYRTLTVVLGAPRSGTTWLSKIFDSHPDVVYRHEPDLVDIHPDVPHICPDGDEARHVAVTRAHFLALRDRRSLKTVGSRPFFPKSYESAPIRYARIGLLTGLRGLLPFLNARVVNRVPVPEFITDTRRRELHMVMKSVVSMGRAGLLAEALPEARFVLILRNPFGQIASRIRGEAARKLDRRIRDPELPGLRRAREFGLTEAVLNECSDVEYLAWEWAVLTQKAIDEMEARENVRLVRHKDLVRDPLVQARRLLEFAGLDWREENAEFVARSSTHQGPDGYFQVMRDRATVLDRWRKYLSKDQQDAIAGVIRRTPLAERWPELFSSARAAEAAA
jgi:hypothetical protein